MSPLSGLEDMLRYVDQPPFLAGASFIWGMESAAYRRGVRVLLSGMDGDTVVHESSTRLVELARGGRWITLVSELEALSSVLHRSRRGLLLEVAVRSLKPVALGIIKPILPEPTLRAWRALRQIRRPPPPADTVIRSRFAREVDLPERTRGQQASPPEKVRFSQEHHWRGLVSGAWPYAFELHNNISASFPVEDSHPFFDRRLLELCLAVPPEQKFARGYARLILRRAMAGVLP